MYKYSQMETLEDIYETHRLEIELAQRQYQEKLDKITRNTLRRYKQLLSTDTRPQESMDDKKDEEKMVNLPSHKSNKSRKSRKFTSMFVPETKRIKKRKIDITPDTQVSRQQDLLRRLRKYVMSDMKPVFFHMAKFAYDNMTRSDITANELREKKWGSWSGVRNYTFWGSQRQYCILKKDGHHYRTNPEIYDVLREVFNHIE